MMILEKLYEGIVRTQVWKKRHTWTLRVGKIDAASKRAGRTIVPVPNKRSNVPSSPHRSLRRLPATATVSITKGHQQKASLKSSRIAPKSKPPPKSDALTSHHIYKPIISEELVRPKPLFTPSTSFPHTTHLKRSVTIFL